MIILKSMIGGAVGALMVGATWLAAELTLLWLRTNQFISSLPEGGGGLGAVSVTTHVPEAAFIGFLLGGWWEWRRASRRHAPPARRSPSSHRENA